MDSMKSDSIELFVHKQTHYLCDLWNDCNDEHVPLPLRVTSLEKNRNESQLSELLGWMSSQLDRNHMNMNERKAFSDQMRSKLKQAGRSILNFTDEQMDCLEELGISKSAGTFYYQAKAFNPFMTFESIFQASRNVWTSNYLQVLLGLPVELSPSIFAYSMLYPVSDNFLDDPKHSSEEKFNFNMRFTAWLKGECATPECWDEEDALDLVKMIEGQYPRERFPQVYEGLLAIHRAQIKSLKMTKPEHEVSPADVIAMTFEKGGTSVLADGILAAGELSNEEMEIIFNYGAFAQLMDDQEDILGDFQEGSVTLFTQAALKNETDQVMNRVFLFANRILKGLQKFNNAKALPLKQMSMKGIDLLLIDGILRTEKCYTKRYLKNMEDHFPFRFEYMKKVRKEIKKKGISTEQLIELLIEREPLRIPMPERNRNLVTTVTSMAEVG